MFFGANRIPEIARGIGKGIREVRSATEDIKNEINKTSAGSDIKKFQEKIEKEKKDIEEITGAIKRNKFQDGLLLSGPGNCTAPFWR